MENGMNELTSFIYFYLFFFPEKDLILVCDGRSWILFKSGFSIKNDARSQVSLYFFLKKKEMMMMIIIIFGFVTNDEEKKIFFFFPVRLSSDVLIISFVIRWFVRVK